MSIKDLKAKDIMLANPISIPPSEQVAAADLLMTRNNMGGLPVIDFDGNLIGMITLRDIMLSRFSISVGGMSVEDMMEKNPYTISLDTTLKEILKIMMEKNIKHIPVVENGKLVGLIVRKEILKKIYDRIK